MKCFDVSRIFTMLLLTILIKYTNIEHEHENNIHTCILYCYGPPKSVSWKRFA